VSLKGLSFQPPISTFRRGRPARARALMECGREGTSLTRSYTYRSSDEMTKSGVCRRLSTSEASCSSSCPLRRAP
jgi:hypothetical protein